MNDISAELEQKVQVESIKTLYTLSQRVIPFNVFLITVIVFLLWNQLPQQYLLIAWVSLIAIVIMRHIHIRYQLKRVTNWEQAAKRLEIQFILGIFSTSLIWSAIFLVTAYYTSELYEFFILWVMGGLIVGSIVSTTNNKLAFFSFMLPMMLIAFFWYFLQFTKVGLAVSIVIVLYMINTAITYIASYNLSYQKILLQFEKDHLIASISKVNKQMEALSRTDELTQIPNRRHLINVLEKERHRSYRDKLPLSLAMIDVDFFKPYNDHYGHIAGDKCLKQIADIISTEIKRAGDILGRYGGEEFLVIMTNTNKEGAENLAHTIHNKVSQANIPHEDSPLSQHITISIGTATIILDKLIDSVHLINMADKALYTAKKQGRNQVVST